MIDVIQNQPPAKRGPGRPRRTSPLPPPTLQRTLTRAGVGEALNCSRQKTYDLERTDPDFPEPVYVGSAPLWLEKEVAAYLQKKADERPRVVREHAAEAAQANEAATA